MMASRLGDAMGIVRLLLFSSLATPMASPGLSPPRSGERKPGVYPELFVEIKSCGGA
jgi:hypothetical protein